MATIPALSTTALDPQVGAQLILTSVRNTILPIPAALVVGASVLAAPRPTNVNSPRPVGHPI